MNPRPGEEDQGGTIRRLVQELREVQSRLDALLQVTEEQRELIAKLMESKS